MSRNIEKILVTGASGFVGGALCARLDAEGLVPRRSLRVASTASTQLDVAVTGDLGARQDWAAALDGVSCVVHCAARVHVMQDSEADPLAAFRAANVEGTLNLARQAAAAGVKRFVFVSSIKVNGERTAPGRPFRSDDAPAPLDPYGISKAEAEDGLRRVAEDSGMEWVIVRPPLVYGPGVRANFRQMLSVVRRGIPLPLGSIDNRRSMVNIDNLVDLLVVCSRHPAAAGHVFLAGDGDDVSTPELLRRVGVAIGRPARLLSVPAAMVQFVGRVTGRQDMVQRLCESLQVDISDARHLLGWTPPHSMQAGLRATAQAYLAE